MGAFGECLQVLHDGGKVEFVACTGKAPQPPTRADSPDDLLLRNPTTGIAGARQAATRPLRHRAWLRIFVVRCACHATLCSAPPNGAITLPARPGATCGF